ncbi:MAG: M48 family metallopeptidase [Muribaculaceae bacterium]|nr:M48 family metallopeptidase [Muribaculaceae bacterium]
MNFLSAIRGGDMVTSGMEFVLDNPPGVTACFTVNRLSRRVTARWRGGKLHVVVPPSMPVGQAVEALASMGDRIASMRPRLRFHNGQLLEFDGFTVSIATQSLSPGKVTLTGRDLYAPTISVAAGMDFDDDGLSTVISRLMCVVARRVAPSLLLPRARELAAACGPEPRAWTIARGHRTLGTCRRDKTISLSAVLVFLPQRLRDYVICHELAHLTEMNHGPRFHALCDRYCGGREAELVRELKHFQWPIIRL